MTCCWLKSLSLLEDGELTNCAAILGSPLGLVVGYQCSTCHILFCDDPRIVLHRPLQ